MRLVAVWRVGDLRSCVLCALAGSVLPVAMLKCLRAAEHEGGAALPPLSPCTALTSKQEKKKGEIGERGGRPKEKEKKGGCEVKQYAVNA